MYASHFGLKREPFSIAPDPRYLFMSERHREALAHLLYGVNGGGGFVLLTGEIGAGKTTVCRAFLEQVPRRCNVAYIFNPKLTVSELLRSVCEEFGVPWAHPGGGEPTIKDLIDPLNEYLLRTHAVGQNNLLIIDEAQNLSSDVLEQLRLLTNLETNERKLLQIILIGQPELRDMLARPELEQLAQRVIARFHLDALCEDETAHYIHHRLTVAGRPQGGLFDRAALKAIHRLTRGVPRRINLLCDRALLGAYAGGRLRVDRATALRAADEVFGTAAADRPGHRGAVWWRRLWRSGRAGLAVAGMVSLAGLAVIGWWATHRQPAASTMSRTLVLPPASPAARVAAAPAQAAPAQLATGADVLAVAWAAEDEAWRMLAARWNWTVPDAGAAPCTQAARAGLQCFRGTGGVTMARRLGRPGLMRLRTPGGGAAFVLLSGLDAHGLEAVIDTTAGARRVPMGVLAPLWPGDFSTLWRTPPAYPGKLPPGHAGEAVVWLADRLAAVDGGAAAQPGQRLDAALQARVQAFQQTQGLKADGVVGPTTLMLLNRASGINEPPLDLRGS
ncbi:peptidoglycan-binding protein [Aquabacterium olei]|uniref:Peptidoglycan-binding protein n=1 Tax=Aquabacterium olei TaxID=1296669 RepID=A0A2U8FU13_9BURK|nr:AAA family ATPase [Aquabacterium olei]AWI54549.1 peptidoglycan-binding protein [Aquabacterium olei]